MTPSMTSAKILLQHGRSQVRSTSIRGIQRTLKPRTISLFATRRPRRSLTVLQPTAFPGARLPCTRHQRHLSTSAPAPPEPPKYAYHVAAAFSAKDDPYDPATHVYHFNPYNRVRPPKNGKNPLTRVDSGQDAFFVSHVGDGTSAVALGVADGVGGWMDSGVDPADFSHGFCDYMAAAAWEHKTANRPPATPGGTMERPSAPLTARGLMQKGYEAVCYDPGIRAGGSTAVVALLGEDGTADVANLGDSGFVLLRPSRVHAYSTPQTHAFNAPFQLAVVPPQVLRRIKAFGGSQFSDLPQDADESRHALRHGDVLVLASDGLWDNMFDQEILSIVSEAMTRTRAWKLGRVALEPMPDLSLYTRVEPFGAVGEDDEGSAPATSGLAGRRRPTHRPTVQSLVATSLVEAAKMASVSTTLDGPFAKEVNKAFPQENWRGGKVDDICVVVVVVSQIKTPAMTTRI